MLPQVRRALRQQHRRTGLAVDESDEHGGVATRRGKVGKQAGRRRANDTLEQLRHRILLRRHGSKTSADALPPMLSP
jgi:hypothetical protein